MSAGGFFRLAIQKNLTQRTLTGNICKNTKIKLVSFLPSSLKWIVLEWAISNTFLINPAPCLPSPLCIHESSVPLGALEGLECAVCSVARSLLVLEWNDGIVEAVGPRGCSNFQDAWTWPRSQSSALSSQVVFQAHDSESSWATAKGRGEYAGRGSQAKDLLCTQEI